MELNTFPRHIWTVEVNNRRRGTFTTRTEARTLKHQLVQDGRTVVVKSYVVDSPTVDSKS